MNADFHNIWSEDLDKIIKANPAIMDQWVVAISCCYQYAEGICGQDFSASIIFKEMDYNTGAGCGFTKKGDWRRELDPAWVRAVTKKKTKGRKTPYGEVGARYRVTKVMKFKDLVYKSSNGEWFFRRDKHSYYFDYSTPRAVDGRAHKATPKEPTPPTL